MPTASRLATTWGLIILSLINTVGSGHQHSLGASPRCLLQPEARASLPGLALGLRPPATVQRVTREGDGSQAVGGVGGNGQLEPPKGLRLWSSAPELHGHQQIKCPWVLGDPRRLTRALTQPRCQASTREAEDSAVCCFERSLLTLPGSLEPSISLASQTPGGATGREEACGRRLASAPACAVGGGGATAESRDHPPMPPLANLQRGWVWWGQSGPSATVSPRALPPNRTDPTPCRSSPGPGAEQATCLSCPGPWAGHRLCSGSE